MIINSTEKWGKNIQTMGYNDVRTLVSVYTMYLGCITLVTTNKQLFLSIINFFPSLSLTSLSCPTGMVAKQFEHFLRNQINFAKKKVNVRSWCHLFLALLTLIEFRQRPFHEIVFFSAWGNSCDSSQILNRWSGSYSALCLRPHNKRTVSIACLANFVASWL